jgi:transposase
MRENLGLFVCTADRARLAAIVADRNRAQKHVWRARVVLLSADRLGTAEIMRRTGLSKPSVWRWQERYIEAGVDGLLRDKTRPSRVPPLDRDKVAEVIRRTLEEPAPGEATHWTVRAMARASGVSSAKVHQIWHATGLAPHRLRRFKLSTDPAFAAKVEDVVGLYVAPPKHAIVLSVDEKSQIQALDRTQPGLPMKPGRLGTPWGAGSPQPRRRPMMTNATAPRRSSPRSTFSTAR